MVVVVVKPTTATGFAILKLYSREGHFPTETAFGQSGKSGWMQDGRCAMYGCAAARLRALVFTLSRSIESLSAHKLRQEVEVLLFLSLVKCTM